MVKSLRSAWFGVFQRVGGTSTSRVDGAVERHPAESLVVLPDGELMYVRHASLAAAKDLLATQSHRASHAGEPGRPACG